MKTIDQIDLLREQQKILAGEVALHSSALKRLSEEAARNPQKEQLQVIYCSCIIFIAYCFDVPEIFIILSISFKVEIKKLRDEIKGKNDQIALLEKQIADSIMTSHNTMDNSEVSQVSLASFISDVGTCLSLKSVFIAFVDSCCAVFC